MGRYLESLEQWCCGWHPGSLRRVDGFVRRRSVVARRERHGSQPHHPEENYLGWINVLVLDQLCFLGHVLLLTHLLP